MAEEWVAKEFIPLPLIPLIKECAAERRDGFVGAGGALGGHPQRGRGDPGERGRLSRGDGGGVTEQSEDENENESDGAGTRGGYRTGWGHR